MRSLFCVIQTTKTAMSLGLSKMKMGKENIEFMKSGQILRYSSMNQNNTSKAIRRLSLLGGFKIEAGKMGDSFHIEADGIRFDGSYLSVEESIDEALIYILARVEARELVKKAKCVLE